MNAVQIHSDSILVVVAVLASTTTANTKDTDWRSPLHGEGSAIRFGDATRLFGEVVVFFQMYLIRDFCVST